MASSVAPGADARDIHARKREHLQLAHRGAVVGAAHGGLFEEIELVHDALPELALHELDLRTPFLRHELRAPLMITGMTGGPEEAREINRGLAKVCQRYGLAMGLGSQRVITKSPESLASFQVRDVAPMWCCSATSAWPRREISARPAWPS